MQSLKLSGSVVPLRLPDVADRLALLECHQQYKKKPGALVRIRMAALGLSWPCDQVPPPWEGGLPESDWDLVAFGGKVAKALSSEPDKIAVDIASHVALGEIFSSVIPAEKLREKAKSFLEKQDPAQVGSAMDSTSVTNTSAAPSPSST